MNFGIVEDINEDDKALNIFPEVFLGSTQEKVRLIFRSKSRKQV